MPVFDLIALGCGGGPSEHNLSCYLFKPHETPWSDGMVALEAGSGIGALARLLDQQPDLFGSRSNTGADGEATPYSAAEVYSWIRCFLITHAHLDHMNSLVLSAGSLGGPGRSVLGAHRCLKDIESIFSDRIWPKLVSWSADDPLPLTLSALPEDDQYHLISPGISARLMSISHGLDSTLGTYYSSAFFIRHNQTAHEFLFFGDVEPDSIAAMPRNRNVWQAAASKIPDHLNTIFIECSWTSGRKDNELYGHLSPEHLSAELTALAVEVVDLRTRVTEAEDTSSAANDGGHPRKKQKRDPRPTPILTGALHGVRVYIIHCKDDVRGVHSQPINQVIAAQVRALTEAQNLGVEIIAVDQGMQISI